MTTTKKPQTERVSLRQERKIGLCKCGHSPQAHFVGSSKVADRSCRALASIDTMTLCPCPAFTPKKEKARP